jgi:hypothetical protein
MKFKYTNSNNEEAYFDTLPLTSELYEQLLEIDKEFLQNIVDGKETYFKDASFKEAAENMLKSFGKGKHVDSPKTSEDMEILFVREKRILKETILDNKQVTLTPKKLIRSKMITSKIRAFKKEKMDLNFELAN